MLLILKLVSFSATVLNSLNFSKALDFFLRKETHTILLKSLIISVLSFSKYTDDGEVYRRLIKIKIPEGEEWSDLWNYQEERDKDD